VDDTTTIGTHRTYTVDWVTRATVAHNELTTAGLYRVLPVDGITGQ